MSQLAAVLALPRTHDLVAVLVVAQLAAPALALLGIGIPSILGRPLAERWTTRLVGGGFASAFLAALGMLAVLAGRGFAPEIVHLGTWFSFDHHAATIVDAMIASDDTGKRTLGLKALTRWPDATVAPRLFDRIAATRDQAERDLLLGALIRIAPLPDNKLDDAGKLDLVKRTMALCTTDADRTRLLERANAIRTVETFRFVVPYLDQPALAPAACKSVVELAHHRNLRDAHKAEFLAALDRVIATAQDAELVERAGRYKEGKTWERKR